MYDEPYGYDHDGDGWLDGEDSGSFWDYDFDGDGDIDADDDFYGFMMLEEGDFCFIATAVYGDIDHPKVVTIRLFRDQVLRNNSVGRAVIRWYYRYGKEIARKLKGRKWVCQICRWTLDGLVWLIGPLANQS